MSDALGQTMPLVLAGIEDQAIPLLVIGAGSVVALVWVVASTVHGLHKTKHREQTRREIAAYVAEGSISAQEGERLIRAAHDAESKQDKEDDV